ncbi:MAG TPA: hypothetical protein VJL57_01245 [Candidatus Paceibacterota bacterium]
MKDDAVFNTQEAIALLNALPDEKDGAKREKGFCDIVEAALQAEVRRYRADLSVTVRDIYLRLDLEDHPVAEEIFQRFENKFPA